MKYIKVRILLSAIFLFITILLISCNRQSDILNKEERNWLNSRNNEIVLAPDPLFFPYELQASDGSFDGMVSKYVKLIEKKLNVKVKIKWYDNWSDNVQGAKNREFDFWSAVAFTKEREKYMLYSKPYFDLNAVLLVREDSKIEADNLPDLYNTKVGVTKDWFTHDYLKDKMPDSLLIPYLNDSLGFEALKNGDVSCYISTQAYFYYARQKYLKNIKILFNITEIEKKLHFASRNDEPVLASILEKGLASITDEEKNSIVNSWFSLDDKKSTNKSSVNRLYLLIFGIILLFFWLINFKKFSTITNISMIIAILILLGTFLFLYSKHTNKPLLTAEELLWLESHKDSLVIAPDVDFAPYEWITENNEFKGIAADYTKKIEEILGVKFKIKEYKSWSENLEAAKKGEVAIWSAVISTKERREYMNFTSPYISMPIVIITRLDKKELSLENWDNQKTLAVVKNYFTDTYLKDNYPTINKIRVPSSREGLYAVAVGDIDAFFVDIATASYLIEQERITSLHVVKLYNISDGHSFAVKKEWPILISILEKALRNT